MNMMVGAGDGAEAQESGGSGEVGGGGGGGGNRWPRQETLALLKIRSEMDVAFRDSTLKGPLWDQISRKMADHGYHRNPKKCKEKFENVFKYHKRTKGSRSSKPDGKTYRFFDQLEALENTTTTITPSTSSYQLPPPPLPQSQPPPETTTMVIPMQVVHPNPTTQMATLHQHNVTSTRNTTSTSQNFTNLMTSTSPPPQVILQPSTIGTTTADVVNMETYNQENNSLSFMSNSTSSSSSTSSDEDTEQRHKRKRKWKDLFDRLMKDVIDKQEELHKSFLDSLEKRERDRMIREESWRVQEMERINCEHDRLVQERSMAAARESALISFLQQMSNQQNPQNQNDDKPPTTTSTTVLVSSPQVHAGVQLNIATSPPQPHHMQQPPRPSVVTTPPPILPPPPQIRGGEQTPITPPTLPQIRGGEQPPKSDNGGGSESYMGSTSSRWPKTEVEALIKLRTELDNKYQENGPKGPLWEDISAGMRKIGYNRNAKRCKEKWENINKYFKKVKESNKKRPEDSKTCPYFHQLDALYREKASAVKPESSMMPIMAQPENQWPLIQGQGQCHPDQQQMLRQHQGGTIQDHEGDNINDHEDADDGDEDDDDEGSAYEIVTNKPSSSQSPN